MCVSYRAGETAMLSHTARRSALQRSDAGGSHTGECAHHSHSSRPPLSLTHSLSTQTSKKHALDHTRHSPFLARPLTPSSSYTVHLQEGSLSWCLACMSETDVVIWCYALAVTMTHTAGMRSTVGPRRRRAHRGRDPRPDSFHSCKVCGDRIG